MTQQTCRSGGHRHGGAVLSLDYCAYASAIRGWNSGYKAALSAACILLCIAFDSPLLSAAVLLSTAFVTVVLGKLPLRRYLSLLAVPLLFLVMGSAAIAFSVSRQPVGDYRVHLGFFYLYATRGSLRMALCLVLKALGAVSAMYMLTLSTPAGEVIHVLRALRVPKLLVELMHLIYRYIFILMDAQCRMRCAAASRLGYCDYRTSLTTFARTAANLLVVSLRRGNAYYQALLSRCYDGEIAFLTEEKPVRPAQVLWAALFLSALAAIGWMGR